MPHLFAVKSQATPTEQPSGSSYWRRRWQAWARLRHPPCDSQQLAQRSIYVLPTKAGWFLAFTLLLLLLASINFQLNLGYLLTFWLLATALMSVRHAHRNLRGLQVQLGALEPVFQHQNAQIPVRLQSAAGQDWARYAITLAWVRSRADVLVDIPSGQMQTTHLALTPTQRGWQTMPLLQLRSLYPLGVFGLWSYWQPKARLLVYPAPETPCPPIQQPEVEALQHHAQQAQHSSGAQAQDDVRPYQRGDRMSDMAWKKSAPALASGVGELVVRSGQASAPPQLWLDARATGLAPLEAQIARLTAWVLHADQQGARWGLRLPSGAQLAPDSGQAHLHACLRALALDGLAADAQED